MRIRFMATRWQEEDLAKRLGAIISGEVWADYDRSSRKWLLDRGNDYWLHPEGGGVYLLTVRYWQRREEEIKALAKVMSWLVGGIEKVQVE